MEKHGYAPPENFLVSLMECPDPRTEEYREKLTIANGGAIPPLLVENDNESIFV